MTTQHHSDDRAPSRKGPGLHMHRDGGFKLDPTAPGINALPDGKVALSPQRAGEIADAINDYRETR